MVIQFQASSSKWNQMDRSRKSLTWINILAIVRKDVLSKLILNFLKKLRELQNDYPLAPDKLEIKLEMFSNYQLKIADLCNIAIGKVSKS